MQRSALARRPLANVFHLLYALGLLAFSRASSISSTSAGSSNAAAADNGDRRQWLQPGKPTLTLEAADAMADAALSEVKTRGFNDVAVYVLDAHGRTVVSKTMLNCPNLPQNLAHAKAMACVATHSASSRAIKDKYVPDRTPQLLAMAIIGTECEQPIAAVPGGVLCRDEANNVVGAVGVSGASADEDEHLAVVAAQAVPGIVTQPSTSPLE